eukprot:GHVT01004939.1.p1 GENE.GHVT01004939.1~~GHVT01004939.1.p1  ORF type:complete len:417 (+),score=103.81 GHVT01004939.1:216-1466(+)
MSEKIRFLFSLSFFDSSIAAFFFYHPTTMAITTGTQTPTNRYRVLVCDSIDAAGVSLLASIAAVEVRGKLSEEELTAMVGDYDALMVRSATKVTAKVLAKADRLKIVGRAGVGVDNVDLNAATNKGIYVVNSPMGNTVAAAEHTLTLMFAISRHVAAAHASMVAGSWRRNDFMGSQLQHKTLGIVGLGQVGGHVGRVCRELGMSLMAYDPFANTAKAEALGCRLAPLDEVLAQADIISFHVPLNEETKNFIDKKKFALMKSSAKIINTSRGGIIHEDDLCQALEKKQIAGAALDVFEVEPLSKDSPLFAAPNLLMTPHLGASTFEAQASVAVDVAQQIKETLLGSLPMSAVNIPGMRLSELQHLIPLLRTCEVLGRIAMQSLDGPVKSINVILEGSYAEEKGNPFVMAVTKASHLP